MFEVSYAGTVVEASLVTSIRWVKRSSTIELLDKGGLGILPLQRQEKVLTLVAMMVLCGVVAVSRHRRFPRRKVAGGRRLLLLLVRGTMVAAYGVVGMGVQLLGVYFDTRVAREWVLW
ncbi:unnamed protein product [Linum trigynum]|uniref:Uncharacterized protein n=1 Tax=Linum trigynum TaxID=586398 RepID=A0AAV2CSE0_9ROSI